MDDDITKKISKFHNSHNIEMRRKMCLSGIEAQIGQLKLEKKRLNRVYLNSIAEINNHIRNLERSALRLFKQLGL